jgi:hypothetical protein
LPQLLPGVLLRLVAPRLGIPRGLLLPLQAVGLLLLPLCSLEALVAPLQVQLLQGQLAGRTRRQQVCEAKQEAQHMSSGHK